MAVIRREINHMRDRVATHVFRERNRRRWSQRTLAQRVGVSDRTIRNIEHREGTPRPVVLERLDEVLSEDQSV